MSHCHAANTGDMVACARASGAPVVAIWELCDWLGRKGIKELAPMNKGGSLELAGLRALWRLIVPGPINDADRLGWQTAAAYVTHILFYVCFFGLPLSGWAMWSAVEGEPLRIAGIVPFPNMPFDTLAPAIQWWILDWGEGIHALLILLLVAMIPIHVGAALKHHFWDRHDVLRGMLPDLEGDAEKAPPHRPKPPRPRKVKAGG